MLKQLIPTGYCLKCNICCRFGQKNSVYAPKFLPREASCLGGTSFYLNKLKQYKTSTLNNDIFICEFFLPSTNTCSIYEKRPLDCQLYPFMLTYDKTYENIILVADTKCPYIKDAIQLEEYVKHLVEFLKEQNLPHNFIMPYQEDTIMMAVLKNLNGFKALALEHKNIFDGYLNAGALSTRSFVNVYVWSDLFNILWKIIDNNLCIFYEYKNEFNMLLPPISPYKELSKEVVKKCIKLLKPASRIENISKGEIKILKDCGLKIYKNTDEYIYLAKDLAELKGNKFASHRASVNQFIKNQKYTYRRFDILDADECLDLYSKWAEQKKQKSSDSVYQQLLEDNFTAHKKAMLNYEALGLIGRVVEIDGKIRAYTFGFELNDVGAKQCSVPTYCVLFETADTAIKGLAQYIYKIFAQELVGLKAEFINAMDDSGMENLRKVKLSYHPYKILSSYIGVL